MKIPKQIKIGNRTLKVQIVDYNDPKFRWDEDSIKIQVDKNATEEKKVEIFWAEVIRAIFDYLNLLEEIEKEVKNPKGLPDMSIENVGGVLKQVIEDNKLDK